MSPNAPVASPGDASNTTAVTQFIETTRAKFFFLGLRNFVEIRGHRTKSSTVTSITSH
jgi:hypothetical protein